MVNIFYSYLIEENHESLLKNFLPNFSINYQEKIKRYKRWQDAQLSLLGRILLFNGIKEMDMFDFKWDEISYTKFNKPYFENNLVNFNISHSGEIVVCAICNDSEIGIDIEIVTEIEIDCYKSQMTENEWAKIVLSNNKTTSFFNYWTQKEAVMKAHGQGLTIPLNSFEIIDNITDIKDEMFFLKEIKIDKNYKCYIASKNNISKISISHHK